MPRALLALLLCSVSTVALGQGCGPQNPNCVVPDRPAGDSSNAAANTRFVMQNGGGGGGGGIPAGNTGAVLYYTSPVAVGPSAVLVPNAVLLGSNAGPVSLTPPATGGLVLTSIAGGAPQWQPASGGGSGLPTPGNTGGVVYYTSTTTGASSPTLTANAVVVGGGASGPTTIPIPLQGGLVLTSQTGGGIPQWLQPSGGGGGGLPSINNLALIGNVSGGTAVPVGVDGAQFLSSLTSTVNWINLSSWAGAVQINNTGISMTGVPVVFNGAANIMYQSGSTGGASFGGTGGVNMGTTAGGINIQSAPAINGIFYGCGCSALLVFSQVGTAASATLPEIGGQFTLNNGIGITNQTTAYKVALTSSVLANNSNAAASYAINTITDGLFQNYISGVEADVNNHGNPPDGTMSGSGTALSANYQAATGNVVISQVGYWAAGTGTGMYYGFACSYLVQVCLTAQSPDNQNAGIDFRNTSFNDFAIGIPASSPIIAYGSGVNHTLMYLDSAQYLVLGDAQGAGVQTAIKLNSAVGGSGNYICIQTGTNILYRGTSCP